MFTNVYAKTDAELNAVKEFAAVIRQRATERGYGAEADAILNPALATFGRHPATNKATEFAEAYVAELFNGGTVARLDRDEITKKVVEVFCAGHDAGSA